MKQTNNTIRSLMQRMTASILSVLLTGTAAAGTVSAEETGTHGPLNYMLYSDHVTIISCDHSEAVIEIPSEIEGLPVTEIGKNAFKYTETLKQVTIPDSVTTIGDFAFDTSGITSIVIPEGVTAIGEWAFSGCENLTSAVLPKSLVYMGDSVFSGNPNLWNVALSEGITELPNEAFRDCDSLTEILIPRSVKRIGDYAFAGDPLTTVYYGGNEYQWTEVKKGMNNPELSSANMVYDCSQEAAPTLGNVNGDANVDASDAAIVLIAAAMIGSGNPSGLDAQQTENGDIDKDGALSAADAAFLLEYASYTGSGGTKTLSEYLRGK